ncbi:hypothetical protein MRB53_039678 [Persea americana]|nr:hypothetical protein MRB53_039678 [Persea americana]
MGESATAKLPAEQAKTWLICGASTNLSVEGRDCECTDGTGLQEQLKDKHMETEWPSRLIFLAAIHVRDRRWSAQPHAHGSPSPRGRVPHTTQYISYSTVCTCCEFLRPLVNLTYACLHTQSRQPGAGSRERASPTRHQGRSPPQIRGSHNLIAHGRRREGSNTACRWHCRFTTQNL